MASLGSASAPSAQAAAPKPYFLSYEVADATSIDISAQYGAITGSNKSHRRTADVEVRLGSPAQDNTHGDHRNSALTTMAMPLQTIPRRTAPPLPGPCGMPPTGVMPSARQLPQVKTEQQVRAREEDSSSDFSAEKPARALLQPAHRWTLIGPGIGPGIGLGIIRETGPETARPGSSACAKSPLSSKQYPDIFYTT